MANEDRIMYRHLLAFCCLSILGLAGSSQAADILADNLGNTLGGDVTITDSTWSAQAFTTTLTGFVIDSITLNMTRDGSTTGTVELYIYELDVNNKPASLPLTFVGSKDIATELSTSPGNVDFPGLSITLDASTTYYLVMRGSSVADGTARWSYTDDETGTGFPSYYARSIDTGATWLGPLLDSPQIMKITAVPEPSTITLSAFGAIAIGLASRRRRN